MASTRDLLITAIAPAIWGSTYIVTTQFLPAGYPMTVAMLRALPAGLLLLVLVRQLPTGIWWPRIFLLGFFNFAAFWILLFVSAYRLPGGVAATLGAIQPLIVIGLARVVLAKAVRPLAVVAALAGLGGVALLVMTPAASLDLAGVAAGLAGSASMACGTVFSRKWQPPVSLLTFTAWQLTAGGILLVPMALIFEPALPPLTMANIGGFLWLGLIGAALTYIVWFRGIQRLEPSAVAPLGFLSPTAAVLLGWIFLGQSLTPIQLAGIGVVIGSVWLSQRLQVLRTPGVAAQGRSSSSSSSPA